MAALNFLRNDCRWGSLLLCSVLFIVACGGSDSFETGSTTAAPTATLAPQPTATQESSGGGDGNLSLDEALDEVIELYRKLLAVLTGVTDEVSAKAAVDDVVRISSQFEDLEERMGDYSQAEIANAAISGRLSGFGEELSKEMIRITSDPAIYSLLAEAFGDLN